MKSVVFSFSVFFSMIYSLYLPAKEFVVGVQDVSYYPLYDFPNPSHSKDLLDAFAQSKGYKFIYIKLPILRFDSWYEEENIDFKYPDNVRWFPDKKIQPLLKFSSQTVELVAGALTRKEGDYLLRSDVKKLGTLLGFHPSLWLDLIENGHTQLIESPSTINIVKQALLGSVDAINLEPSVVNHHLKRLKKENQLVINKELPLQIYSYHLSTIKYPEVMKEFNMFLAENQVLLETLKTKYQLVDVEPYRKLVSK